MQFRGSFPNFFDTTLLPAVDAKIWQSFNAKAKMAPRILDTENITRDIKQYASVHGVGLPALIAEGEDIGVDAFVGGPSKTFKPAKYGLGIAMTQELIEDDQFGIASKRSAKLGDSINQSIEIQGASVLNNAFSTGDWALPDTKALCASDHPLYKAGGTQSNVLSVAADLDVTSLELALTDWGLTKTHEGFLQQYPTPRVLVAEQNRWNVMEILKSAMRSDTANNTANAFKYAEGGMPEPLIWAYLTDPDAWFLVAPPSETEMVWVWRKKPYTKSDYIEKSETAYVYMRYRATFGAYGWRGVYGTPGA